MAGTRYIHVLTKLPDRPIATMTARILFLLTTALLLSACQTMTPEERRARDENTCRSYGFKRGTDAFAACLQRIDLDRRADARAFHARHNATWANWNRPVYVVRPVIVRP